MRRKNTFLVMILFIAVLLLGVGYAVTTLDLNISGTATVTESGSSFSVKFTSANADTSLYDDNNNVIASSTASVDSDDNTKATMAVTLTNVGNSQEVEFKITNASQAGVSAVIAADNVKIYKKGTTEEFTSEYFKVTHDLKDTELASGDFVTFNVKVELEKAVVGSDVTESFDVVLEGISAKQS